ncbi:MAG: hypothetical protein WCP69_07440 [Bacteroidota bacterium]
MKINFNKNLIVLHLIVVFAFCMISIQGFGQIIYGDTIIQHNKVKEMHIGWANARVPEFSNAHILQKHEVRLNLIGRSSYAISNKVEISSYIPLVITPNISVKYKFFDSQLFASAIEFGTAVGIFPVALAGGLMFPGGAIGMGSIGLLYGSDNHAKLFLSLKPSKKLAFSVRGSISGIHAGYIGGGAYVGIVGGGSAAGLIPVNMGKRFRYYSGGFETDYLLNKKNVLVFNSYIGGFEGGNKQLGLATLSWTRAFIHFHYSIGLYGFFDPPKFEMVQESKLPVSFYFNFYWILNNGRTIKKVSY